jgi:hypothetical protein
MKTISPAQCGAVEEALRLGLTDLAPSILEKDLLITEVLGMLAAFDWGEIQAVFCGGTSLSKGHGVIQRMSEDIDFKLALPTSWSRSQARRKLSACRNELAETMQAADFGLPEAGIVTLNENRYFCFSLGYLPQFPLAHGLRAGGYSQPHRDPFDRMLAAQAELDRLVLLTADPQLSTFPCQTLW